jgi:uncharacterized protein YutE (UPF0331/DUF86 family)
MADMRDVLIHDYMGVDLRTVWNVIKDEIAGIDAVVCEKKLEMSSLRYARGTLFQMGKVIDSAGAFGHWF